MSLAERLESARAKPVAPLQSDEVAPDPTEPLKQRIQQALFARLGTRLYDSSIDEGQLTAYVQQTLNEIVELERAPLSVVERQRLVMDVSQDVLGFGPIQQFLDDRHVTEVMVNGTGPIYIERGGRLYKTDSRFVTDEHLRRVIERIVGGVGRRVDESSPMVDARLADGSRVNAIIPPVSLRGPALTIRKFAAEPFSVHDLIQFGTLTAQAFAFLAKCVEGKLSILISGGTGTGKTTLLNVVSGFIPEDERIVSIEDAVELQLRQDHVVALESRPPNIEGRGEITIRDLVRNALRMRPDRIIVGEVRGAEALDMLQAMNTGHEGSLSTLHANSPRDALARLETMVLMAGMDLPMRAIREQIASAIDLVVHVARMKDGSRRVTQITEVHGMEADIVTMQDLYSFNYSAGVDAEGRSRGHLTPTGLRPSFLERLDDLGVHVPAEAFGPREPVVTDFMETRGRRRK
jgi:pilus assembly protein CpaF